MNIGDKIGYLTVIEFSHSDKNRKRNWKCLCKCGKIRITTTSELRKKNTPFKSCGCYMPCKDIKERFLNHVEKTENCWIWKGTRQNKGLRYGYFFFNKENRYVLSHRASFLIFKGEIPLEKKVLHSCDNPICVNPDHLWIGTQKDNMQDCKKKGRGNHAKGEKSYQSVLTENDVRDIRSKYKFKEYSSLKIAKEYGVNKTTILSVIHRKTWKHIT